MSINDNKPGATTRVETRNYLLEINLAEMQAILTVKNTHLRFLFFPGGACNPIGKLDKTISFGRISRAVRGKTVMLSFSEHSSCWRRKTHQFVCAEDSIECFYRVEGSGVVERAHYFRGYVGNEERGMTADMDEIYSTCPNFQEKLYFHPSETATISAGNCLDLPVGCQALASPCDCMGLHDRRDAAYVSVGLASFPGKYNWDAFQWNPPVSMPATAYAGDNVLAGAFAAVFDGKLRIKNEWESPRLIITFAGNRDAVLGAYLRHCRVKGYLPKPPRRKPPTWWYEPIYCTWHDQVAMVEARSDRDGSGGSAKASDFCTQRLCDRWVKLLESHACKPGTVILDDAWAVNRNSADPDPQKWKDLRGWIEGCHKRGIRVSLWFCAWSTDGLPLDECITQNGVPVAADITNPAYQVRFKELIRRCFGNMPDCLNADAVKVDGLLSLPTGKGLCGYAGGPWGLELQRLYLKTLYEEVKLHKPDACVSAYVLNPYLAEFVDVVRCGDMYTHRITAHESMEHRVRLIRQALPDVVVDTDGQFSHYGLDDYAEEFARQAGIGVPSLYNAELVYRNVFFQPLRISRVTPDDYKKFARVMAVYRKKMRLNPTGREKHECVNQKQNVLSQLKSVGEDNEK